MGLLSVNVIISRIFNRYGECSEFKTSTISFFIYFAETFFMIRISIKSGVLLISWPICGLTSGHKFTTVDHISFNQ